MVSAIAAATSAPAPAAESVRALKRLRYERERAALQEEIDRLQQLGGEKNMAEINTLWNRKKKLLQRLEALNF